MVRATLLYDTVAAQLYPKINVFTEFAVYYRSVAEAARKRFLCGAVRTLLTGPDPSCFQRLQDVAKLGSDFLFRAQQLLGTSEFGFMAVMDKVYYAIDAFVNLVKAAVSVAFLLTVTYVAGNLFGLFGPRKQSDAHPPPPGDITTWSWNSAASPHKPTHAIAAITWSWHWTDWTVGTQILVGFACAVLALNVFTFCRRSMARWRDRDNYGNRIGIAV
jgi:hypothetical protein